MKRNDYLELSRDGKTVIRCRKDYVGAVVIPKGVTEIGDDAFSWCTSLTSIVIPNSVTKIGWHPFEGCTSLTSIEIPNSVIAIRSLSFYGCKNLTSIKIPNCVTEIVGIDFHNCTSLKEIIVDEVNANYCSKDGVLYSKDMSRLIAVPKCNASIEIPNSVTKIGDCAFEGCTSLTSIEIPDCMTEIGCRAFEGCASLTSIDIPDSVTKIGDGALSGCTNLNKIIVDVENPYYCSKDGVLYSKDMSRLIAVPGGKESIAIPDSVTKIGEKAFHGCTSLTSIAIPDSVTEIGDNAFEGCTNLTKVHIRNKQPTVLIEAFYSYDPSKITLYVPKGMSFLQRLQLSFKFYKVVIEK